MTPKEKAKELVDRFTKLPEEGSLMWYVSFEIAKKCALIAVDEILKVTAPIIDRFEPYYQELTSEMTQEYWQEVEQEIKNLNN
jgi:hypothetical protein